MGDLDFALMFVAPMDAEGVKLISRASYELVAAPPSPFDYPLTSRFDEGDPDHGSRADHGSLLI